MLAQWLAASPDYALLKAVKLNVVVFRPLRSEPDDCLKYLNSEGDVFMTPGEWQGQKGIRAAFSNWRTTDADVMRICSALARAALA